MSGTGTASDAAGRPAWPGWLGTAGQVAAGAAAGAARGAALGSVVPGVGTAVGAAAGGILGLARSLTDSPVPPQAKPALQAAAAGATGVPASAGEDAQVEALAADPGGAMTQFAAAAREVAEQERTKRVVAGVQAALDARRADLADVADARDHPDAGKAWLAAAVFALFAAVLGGLEFHAVPAGNERIVDTATGGLFTAFIMVVGYYFGSSAGSAYKTRLLARSRGGDGDGTAATRR